MISRRRRGSIEFEFIPRSLVSGKNPISRLICGSDGLLLWMDRSMYFLWVAGMR